MRAYEETASCIADTRPHENTIHQHTTSFSFSLQILAHEGFSVKGDMTMSKTGAAIPARASKPILSTSDVDEQYDDNSVTHMPRSAILFRSTQTPASQQNTRTTGPIQTPVVSHRISGTTRVGLYFLFAFCVLFLVNGLVVPAVTDVVTQLKYGESKVATYDLMGKHWITEESNGRLRLIASNPDGSHSQQLTMPIANAPKHGLVTLKENGQHVDVYLNDAYLTYLVGDGKGGYTWGSN